MEPITITLLLVLPTLFLAIISLGVITNGSIDNITKEQVEKYDGKNSSAIEYLLNQSYRVDPNNKPWLKPAMKNIGSEYEINGKNGHKIKYKCHIAASEMDFDKIIPQLSEYLIRNKIYHKFAPGYKVARKSMGDQYGKIATIYCKSYEDFQQVYSGAISLAKKGYTGISYSNFVRGNHNMKYEVEIPGTNSILYYTIERVDGKYCGPYRDPYHYEHRLNFLMNNLGRGPLDNKIELKNVINKELFKEYHKAGIDMVTNTRNFRELWSRFNNESMIFTYALAYEDRFENYYLDQMKNLIQKNNYGDSNQDKKSILEEITTFTRALGIRNKVLELCK
tara:strand:- start:240 stop:1247 length:1008 start_codon:yes stop_codon:yes gene_type:complete